MVRPRTAIVGLLLLLMAGSIALASAGTGAHGSNNSAPPLAPTTTRLPGAGSAPAAPRDTYLGVILARSSVDVAARFEGRLRDVQVRLGDVVKAGAKLATLEVPTLRYDLSMAEAEAATAKVDYDRAAVELSQAEDRLARRRALSTEGLATGEDLATASYQHKLTRTQVESARAAFAGKQARVNQLHQTAADTEIRAPFDGIIAARYIDPGANVTSSTPIFRLISADDLFVRFAVPEEKASAIAAGAAVQIKTESGGLQGTIDKVSPEIDAASRMVIVEARLDPADSPARPRSGELVHVSIQGNR